MVIEQLKLLISLARIDGEVAEPEKVFIRNIGGAHGVSESQITTLFETEHEPVIPSGLTEEDRFNYIFNLVQLMKIDDRLYREETNFCAGVAAKLGYDKMAMFELLLNVKKRMAADEKENIKELIKQYLK